MDTKVLRQKILDLAIRGKLVPQDPNDEPASVLLEKIRAEKQQMVKEGKLKAKDIKNDTIIYKGEDNLHYEKFSDGSITCIEDEIPFEIPDNWSWCRISSIFYINPRNQINDDLDVSFISMSAISDGYANFHTSEIKKWSKVKSGYTHFKENDIGIAKITPCFENRKSVIFKNLTNSYGAGTTELHILRAINNKISPFFTLYIFKTDAFIRDGISAFTGAVGQKRIGTDFISNYLIALPPTKEQNRIANLIENLFNIVTAIENESDNVLEMINITKNKILELAIRGKLVPQDPNDEPASVLLERIKKEKENLIKQGKIKRDKNESVIFKGDDNSYYEKINKKITCIDANLPFSIPHDWCWERLSNIAKIFGGYGFKSKLYTKNGVRIIRISDFDDNGLLFNDFKYYEENKLLSNYEINNNDILICMTGGTVGKSCLIQNIHDKLYLNQRIASIRNVYNLNIHYLYYVIKSNYIKEIIDFSKISTNDNISIQLLNNLLIPIPPINIQDKITQKISESFNLLDKIYKSLE